MSLKHSAIIKVNQVITSIINYNLIKLILLMLVLSIKLKYNSLYSFNKDFKAITCINLLENDILLIYSNNIKLIACIFVYTKNNGIEWYQ